MPPAMPGPGATWKMPTLTSPSLQNPELLTHLFPGNLSSLLSCFLLKCFLRFTLRHVAQPVCHALWACRTWGSASRYQLGLLRARAFPKRTFVLTIGTETNHLSCLRGPERHPREWPKVYSSERKKTWRQRQTGHESPLKVRPIANLPL